MCIDLEADFYRVSRVHVVCMTRKGCGGFVRFRRRDWGVVSIESTRVGDGGAFDS
jgi:hypothetical protein